MATVAFGLGLDKSDVNAVRCEQLTHIILILHVNFDMLKSTIVNFCIQYELST